jgi:hypothetical protein
MDTAPRFCRLNRRQKRLISSDGAKPSRGLEPRTPSLPWRLRARRQPRQISFYIMLCLLIGPISDGGVKPSTWPERTRKTQNLSPRPVPRALAALAGVERTAEGPDRPAGMRSRLGFARGAFGLRLVRLVGDVLVGACARPPGSAVADHACGESSYP